MMKKIIILKVVVIILVLFGANQLTAQNDAREIFIKATQIISTANVELSMAIEMTDDKDRLKSKELTVLLAKFGDEEKTKVTWQKPERAAGTTIIITETPGETGIIEVYTPSNGKIRKLKATENNMNMMGAEFNMASFAKYNPDELNYMLLNDTLINGNSCYQIEVSGKGEKDVSGALLVIGKSTNLILQTTTFSEKHKAMSYTQLLDYKSVNGSANKMYPMHIVTQDYKNKKHIVIRILDVSVKKLAQSDFKL